MSLPDGVFGLLGAGDPTQPIQYNMTMLLPVVPCPGGLLPSYILSAVSDGMSQYEIYH